jgi:hypothetical protein
MTAVRMIVTDVGRQRVYRASSGNGGDDYLAITGTVLYKVPGPT